MIAADRTLSALVTVLAACSGKESGGGRRRLRRRRLRLPSRPIRPARSRRRPTSTASRWSTTTACSTPISSTSRIPEYKGGWNEIHNTARVYTPRGQGDPDAELGHPVLGRRRGPAHRAAGADGPADRAGPLLLAAVRRRLHLQLPLRRQPHHRQRRRQIPSGRAELERRKARGHQRGHPLRHRPGVRAVPHPAVRPVRPRQGQGDPGRISGHAAVGVPEPAAARAGAGDRLRAAADAGPAEDLAAVLRDPRLRNAVRPGAARREGDARPVRVHRHRTRRGTSTPTS